ncbi:MAG TPA: hypothetical protein VFC07_15200 [Verrucomicrobiae bacterium]|nr:hypothetical protein [Verrucomicrobiae bacterium]
MKTPRELILERHRAVEPELLAAIRQEDLAAAVQAANKPRSLGIADILRKLWEESIWPWRRAWLGMAAVWVVSLSLNAATQETPRLRANKAPVSDAQVLAVLREQKQLMAQLLGVFPPVVDSRPNMPKPRSQRWLNIQLG